MTQNVGGADGAVRILAGVALFVLGFLHILTGTLAIVAYIAGGLAIVTGVVRFCPLWSIFGINTCAAKPLQQK